MIVGGASITEPSAWPTWASWVERRYQPDRFINVSVKGLGNEVILLKAVQAAQKLSNPIIVVQLTSVDKWDWYVENPELINQINKERHPITTLESTDLHGFWSTGSHFPLWKEYYRKNYYSIEYLMYKTLLQIQWFQLVCDKNSWQYYILFDSPILSVTEEQLNTGQLSVAECVDNKLVQNTLCKTIYELTNFDNIYQPGLIGYSCINNMAWYSDRFKGHPGSLVHYSFMKDIIAPELDKFLTPMVDFESFLEEAIRFQKLSTL